MTRPLDNLKEVHAWSGLVMKVHVRVTRKNCFSCLRFLKVLFLSETIRLTQPIYMGLLDISIHIINFRVGKLLMEKRLYMRLI